MKRCSKTILKFFKINNCCLHYNKREVVILDPKDHGTKIKLKKELGEIWMNECCNCDYKKRYFEPMHVM